MEHTVVCRNLSKVYRQNSLAVQALADINLEISKKDFLCLSGPSGSGKSTLLNLIGGLDLPTSGDVSVDGIALSTLDRAALARLRLTRIGFVFQAYNLIPVLSARENVEFVMQLQGVNAAERRTRALDILNEVGLAGLEDRKPGELSGGQQQRVAVARAIVSGPSLVLADEPTANLDSKTAAVVMDALIAQTRSHGAALVLVTHSEAAAARADWVVHLSSQG